MPLFDKKNKDGATVKADRASKILSGLNDDSPQIDLDEQKAAEEQSAQEAAEKQAEQQKLAEEQAAQQKAKEEQEQAAAQQAADNDNNQGPDEVSKTPDLPKGPQELTEEVLLEKLSEKLGKKIESFDDLTPKPINIDPEVQQLLDWKKDTGLSLTQWPEYNRDFSQLSDLDVVRETLTKNSPNFTREELEYKMRDYVYDPDNDEESDRVAKSIKLKEAAQQGRQQLEKNKLSLVEQAQAKGEVLSEEVKTQLEYAKQSKAQADLAAKAQKAYEESIKSASNNLEAINLKLNDEFNIKYNLPQEVKNSLPNMVAEMPSWKSEDGSINAQAVVADVAKLTNFDKIVQAAFEQGVNVGKEGMIKKSVNPTGDVIPQKDDEGSRTETNVQEVVSKLTGRNGKSKNLRFRSVKK